MRLRRAEEKEAARIAAEETQAARRILEARLRSTAKDARQALTKQAEFRQAKRDAKYAARKAASRR